MLPIPRLAKRPIQLTLTSARIALLACVIVTAAVLPVPDVLTLRQQHGAQPAATAP